MAISKEEKREYDKKYRKRPEIVLKQRVRNLKRFGITLEQYNRLLEEQKGQCAICKSSDPKIYRIKYLPVDHCHETGKIRGLLCSNCNRGIGFFNEDKNLLKSALEYLIKHE